jgi:5-methyltetrahydrofolate--homocysteine methyltransferase
VQDRDLGPDDFGGPALEGCNERLVLTRPDLIAEMHAEYLEVGVDAVETATFGAFPLVLQYGSQEIRDQRGRGPHRQSPRLDARPPRVVGSIGPHQASLARAIRSPSCDDAETQVDGCSPASTSS